METASFIAVQGVGCGHRAMAMEGFRNGITVSVRPGPPVYTPTSAGVMRQPEYYIVTIRVWFQGIMKEKAFRVRRKALESVICRSVLRRTLDISVDAIFNLKQDENITVEAKLL